MVGLPGGSLVKKLLVNAGDTGLTPGLGRFHMPQSNKAHTPTTSEPLLQSLEAAAAGPAHPRAHAPQQEKSLHPRAGGSPPHPATREKPEQQQPSTAKTE